MKKFLPAFVMFLLALTSCKKEQLPATSVTPVITTPITSSQVTVNGISPASGTAGMVVTIKGTNFKDSTTISFNGVAGTVQSFTATEIKAIAPRSYSGAIAVTTNNQTVTGPAFTYAVPAMNQISPAAGPTGTIVTLSGVNFGTLLTGVRVLFNNVPGTVQSITNTEIKVEVPITTTGKINLILGSLSIIGQEFTYTVLPVTPYISGDVVLKTQLEIDAFVALNKGKQLNITGDLSIGDSINNTDINSVLGLLNINSVSGAVGIHNCPKLTEATFLNTITTAGKISIYGSGLVKLDFNNLQSFSGDFELATLSSLNHVSFNAFTKVGWLNLYSCPLLTDLSFIKNITSADNFTFRFLGPTTITMNNLTSTSAGCSISQCGNLTTVSFNSLTTVVGGLDLSYCQQLSTVGFSKLTSVSAKLNIYKTNLTDLNGFSSVTTLGSLTLYNNPVLTNLLGLKRLTVINSPAIGGGTSSDISTRVNGIYIDSNPKLSSLTGLENITSVPIIYIVHNAALSNFCPLKAPIITLSTSAGYAYRYYSSSLDQIRNATISALTLTGNSSYATTADALAAVKLCN